MKRLFALIFLSVALVGLNGCGSTLRKTSAQLRLDLDVTQAQSLAHFLTRYENQNPQKADQIMLSKKTAGLGLATYIAAQPLNSSVTLILRPTDGLAGHGNIEWMYVDHEGDVHQESRAFKSQEILMFWDVVQEWQIQ